MFEGVQVGPRELASITMACLIIGWVAWHRFGRPRLDTLE